jgi:pimeloyl-ACP methyl ester carboxylesterase
MTNGWIVGTLVLAAGLLGCLLVGWLLVKRPLEVWAWGTRRALISAGLKKVVIQTPVGAQSAFVGGLGPVLVLLHGAGDQAGTWLHVVKSLVKHHTLVIPDLAGHGESAPSTGPIQASDIFSSLEAVMASQAKGQRVTLVGNSLGAWMAMVLASRHPDWVERVIAVNGGPLKGAGEQVNLLPTTREEARKTMAQLRDASSPAIPDKVLDDVVRRAKTGSLARFAATAASMEAWLLTEEQLRTLRVPVRLVWGVSDGLMPLAYAHRMMAVLPDVELIPVDRCGHVPQQEAPDRFRAALSQALGEPVEPGRGTK